MNFMDRVIARSMPLWEAAASEPFVTAMGEGTLSRELFYGYIVQDSIYLRDYLKAYAMAIFKSRTLREMQVFYSALGFVNDSENATRLGYLADAGLTDAEVESIPKRKACADYTRFLVETAEREEIPEILMAVMPCMLGYRYVFEELEKRYPAVLDGYFGPLVRDYTGEGYAAACKTWTDYCEEVCAPLSAERKERLAGIFEEASRHELYFWRMSGDSHETE